MAKFDRASLLLALCVTVILSSWIQISRSVTPPVSDESPFSCPGCEKFACQLYTQVQKAKGEETSLNKISKQQIIEIGDNLCNRKATVEQGDKSKHTEQPSCDSECKEACKEIWNAAGNAVAEYLYNDLSDFDSFVNNTCNKLRSCIEQPAPKIWLSWPWNTKKDENSKNQITECRGLKYDKDEF